MWKVFDYIPHQSLIAKLSAYGFDIKSIALISAYLKNRKPKTKLGSTPVNAWTYLVSLFWRLLYLDFARYADGTTPYVCGQDFNSINKVLKPNVHKLFNWFRQNPIWKKVSECTWLSYNVKLLKRTLGILIDSERTFYDHISSKTNRKLSALALVSIYMALGLLMSSYITSQFNYCRLVWVIHHKKLKKKINKIQERALRIVYSDHKASFSEFLKRHKSVTRHKKKLAIFTINLKRLSRKQ